MSGGKRLTGSNRRHLFEQLACKQEEEEEKQVDLSPSSNAPDMFAFTVLAKRKRMFQGNTDRSRTVHVHSGLSSGGLDNGRQLTCKETLLFSVDGENGKLRRVEIVRVLFGRRG